MKLINFARIRGQNKPATSGPNPNTAILEVFYSRFTIATCGIFSEDTFSAI